MLPPRPIFKLRTSYVCVYTQPPLYRGIFRSTARANIVDTVDDDQTPYDAAPACDTASRHRNYFHEFHSADRALLRWTRRARCENYLIYTVTAGILRRSLTLRSGFRMEYNFVRRSSESSRQYMLALQRLIFKMIWGVCLPVTLERIFARNLFIKLHLIVLLISRPKWAVFSTRDN